MSSDNDFCTKLISGINNFYKTKYRLVDNTIDILTLKLKTMNDNNDYTSVDNMMNKIFFRTNKYLNFCLTIMALGKDTNISSDSKIAHIINSIKQMKVNFYGNTMSIDEHIEHIIKKNLFYIPGTTREGIPGRHEPLLYRNEPLPYKSKPP